MHDGQLVQPAGQVLGKRHHHLTAEREECGTNGDEGPGAPAERDEHHEEHHAEVVQDDVHGGGQDRQDPPKKDEHPAAHRNPDARVANWVVRGGAGQHERDRYPGEEGEQGGRAAVGHHEPLPPGIAVGPVVGNVRGEHPEEGERSRNVEARDARRARERRVGHAIPAASNVLSAHS